LQQDYHEGSLFIIASCQESSISTISRWEQFQ
jgi:hypothetical protein